jgi:hypothetical protein
MKILMTGMSSSHTSPKVHATSFGFFGALHSALTAVGGHEVTWGPADMGLTKKDLDKFDFVFVGIAAPTSVSSNNAYGALNLINILNGSPKLKFVVDSPQSWQIEQSLSSVLKQPDSLIKDFYSKRPGFQAAKSKLGSLIEACSTLATAEWPTTIFPSLPWGVAESLEDNLPAGARGKVVPLNLDFLLISSDSSYSINRVDTWLIDRIDTEWSKKIANLVSNEVQLVKMSKKETDSDIELKLKSSLGLFVSPQKRKGGTWWSYRYIQALNSGTPVATEWRDSARLGSAWGVLPSKLEDMSTIERTYLATKQKESYVSNIPNKQDIINSLNEILR